MKAPMPPVMIYIQKVDAAHRIFRSVLGGATPDAVFEERAVTISKDGKRLYEHTGNGHVLAEAVLGMDFPREAGPIALDHYTSLAGLKAIAASAQLRLHPVTKRLHEDEFTTFAREHDLQGYFDDDGRGEKVLEELAKDLFYISLARPGNPNEPDLWSVFANDGRGVRLRLRLTPKAPADLRRMGYQTGSPTALKRINDALLAQEGLIYTPWTISRICAFYLPIGYREEHEVRLMVKRHVGGPDYTTKGGPWDVWPIALAAPGTTTGDEWCEIELVEVTAGARCTLAAVQNALADTIFSAVTIS
jgi:hypothetical protein